MRYRDFSKMYFVNDGRRSLAESVVLPEIILALTDWAKATSDGVLIGGLALSFWVKPRTTQDVDFLFLSDSEIPNAVAGFKRTRAHAFQHNVTYVEIELVTPELINRSKDIIMKVIEDAVIVDGLKVASPSGIVAMKLGRASFQDKADIVGLIKAGNVDISNYHLQDAEASLFDELKEAAKTDPH